MSTIDLRGISKSYGPLMAVEDLDLSVRQGEFVTILGPSGSGKSTLLALIAGLTTPSRGRILIGGRDITWAAPGARNVGLVFQSYALFPHMSVFDNVAFPLAVRKRPRGEIEARVAEALQMVRLSDLGARKPAQLSGGQQQRVALARAFIFKPEILLLDEPLAALDRKLREEVQVELRHLQRSLGITTILVTHDQEEALSLSDRIVVLDHGRIQQVGTPEDGYSRPANRFVADFLGVANFFDGKVQDGPGGRRMEIGGGASVPCPPAASQAGETRCMLVRPEKIVLHDGSEEDRLAATVKDVIYLGQAVRYQLLTDAGLPVVAVAATGRPFSAGDRVWLAWGADDAWFVAA